MEERYRTYCNYIIGKIANYFGAEFADFYGDNLCFRIVQYMKTTYGPDSKNWELIDEDSEFFLDALASFTFLTKGI